MIQKAKRKRGGPNAINAMTQGLSKSTFLMGLQRSKFLWFCYNAKDQIPATRQRRPFLIRARRWANWRNSSNG